MQKRLASDIDAQSQWQLLYTFGYIGAVTWVLIILNMPWWLIVIISISSVGLFVIHHYLKVHPLHISAPKYNDQSGLWQVQYAGRQRPELWEGMLDRSSKFSHCIQLSFIMHHPISKRRTIVIWKDQVDANSWRQLNALTLWS